MFMGSKMNIMNDKRGIILSLVVIVIMTFMVSGIALFYLETVNNKIEKKFDVSEMEGVYARAEVVDSYLESVFNRAILLKPSSKEDFALKLKSEIERYMIQSESDAEKKEFVVSELGTVYGNLGNQNFIDESVNFGEGKASAEFEIIFAGDNKEGLNIEYHYQKKFEASL